jgi:hypothetical protein
MLTPHDILEFMASSANKSILNLPPSPQKKTREIHGG